MEASQPSITFLNGSGDITITWDEQNKDIIIKMIEKKMKEGYTFFTTKKLPLVNLYRTIKVTKDNLRKCKFVVIDDDAFEKMVQSIDDRDVAEQVRGGNANFARNKLFGNDHKIERDAKKVSKSQSLAVKPISGG